MLKSEHALIGYENGLAVPDRIDTNGRYLDLAEAMVEIYRTGINRTRRSLHRSVEELMPEDKRRASALSKLLDEAGEFETDSTGRSARLRLQVFKQSAGSACRAEEMKEKIANALGRPWEGIEAAMYADLPARHRLSRLHGTVDARALLCRYNVAQAQAALYRALRLRVEATRDFKTILRHAKLARLLHCIHRQGLSRYVIDLSGPAAVLKPTTRYGVNMARFLPSLIACSGWSLDATLRTPWGGNVRLVLSERDGLESYLPPPPEYDSAVEEAFAKSFGTERNGWRLLREAEILHDAQTTFVPDFVLRRRDGRRVLFEIAGYWTQTYLARKREVLKRFRHHELLVAMPEKVVRNGSSLPPWFMIYKKRIEPEAVIRELDLTRHE